MFINVIMVCVGSALGGGSRYMLSKLVNYLWPSLLPIGTIAVNAFGCFLIGFLCGLSLGGVLGNERLKLFLTVGFCGGFTTFSTFMNENYMFAENGKIGLLSLNIVISLVIGYLAVFGGIFVGRQIKSN